MTVIDNLRTAMSEQSLAPLWELEGEIMGMAPRPRSKAWLWRWQDLYAIAERAGELITVDRGGDRRAIALANPGLNGLPYATSTLWAAVQWLNGHEIAPAHRHTSEAVRFIVDGSGGYSTVEGDRVYLERGDMVLTPAWTWHDHGSDSDERSIWIDVLDIPFNNYLDAAFFEPYPDASQLVTEQRDASILKHGVGTLRPAWEQRETTHSPLLVYRWADTERALENVAQVGADPFDDVSLEFINPHTGGPVVPSFTCRAQMLRPGVQTRAHRHTGSSVYLAFEGYGESIIDGVRFEWSPGDLFVIPTWATHEHHNLDPHERAILFSVHDTPLLQAVGKYRVEESAGAQDVTDDFKPV